MALKNEGDTSIILKKLAQFIPGFYVLYYLASIIVVGGYKLDWNELGHLPFRIRGSDFDPTGNHAAKAAFVAMIVAYTATILLTYYIIRVTRKSWDYVATVSLFHFIVCIIVNQAFPVNWIWWVTLVLCTVLLSGAAEVVNYWLREMREIQLLADIIPWPVTELPSVKLCKWKTVDCITIR